MKRFLKIAIPVFIIGFAAGNAFWYLFSPLWIDRVVAEEFSEGLMQQEFAVGAFRDADRSHKGSGKAILVADDDGGSAELRLADFEVTNGPDLEVWLVKDPDPKSSADVKASEWLSLGQLKGNIGNQVYAIPEGTDIGQYGSAVIWCEQFGVLFSAAPFVASTAQ